MDEPVGTIYCGQSIVTSVNYEQNMCTHDTHLQTQI